MVNSKINLSKDESHRLLRVLRLKVGAELVLFDNENPGEFKAKLSCVKNNLAQISVAEFLPRQVESPLKIHLGQVISRGEKMDFTIQKATELGVTTITPLFSERCNVQFDEERTSKRLAHWQKIAIAAAEQSGRISIPKIENPENLSDWYKKSHSEIKLLLSPAAKTMPFNQITSPKYVTLLVGPEGGLSQSEENAAKKQGFSLIKLGPRTFRTETAALAAISILQTKFGDIIF